MLEDFGINELHIRTQTHLATGVLPDDDLLGN